MQGGERQVQWRVLGETAAGSGSPNPARRTELLASSSQTDSDNFSEVGSQSSSNTYGAADN